MGRAGDLSEAKSLLLQRMLRGDAPGASGAADAVAPRASGTAIPVSAEQRHVWMHAAMAPAVPLYNEPVTIHRRGSFDHDAFEQAFNLILERHEIWRSAFTVTDAGGEQIVRPDLRVRFPTVDLTGLPEAEREQAALRIAAEDAQLPFDLAEPPLFRAKLVKLADGDHRLYLTLHHIIFDAVSLYRVLMPELAAAYEAFAAGDRPTLPLPTLQYGDYALWRERHAASDAVAGQLDYWRRELAGEPAMVQLPTDRARPAAPTHAGAITTFTLPRPLTDALKALGRAEGTTCFMTLLAAFKALLFRYSNQDDIVVGGVTGTRSRPELEPLMGYFLNSLALRTRPSADLPFRDYLRQVRNVVVGALGASDVPFERVVQALRPRREPGCHPLFQVLFSVEPPVAPFPPGWCLTQRDVGNGAAKFDLYIEVEETADGLIARVMYSTELFEAATIERMIGHWTTLLEGVTADPGCTLGGLPLMTTAEARRLAVEWNDTSRDYPCATIHALFEAQARRTPEAIAVTCDGVAWTYAALDRRAEQLATRLGAVGVTRETLVALCIERAPDMIAGLLAILKAGGAYLPLDPDFPPARLAMILEDARPAVLLTEHRLLEASPTRDACVVCCDEANTAIGAMRCLTTRCAGPDDLAYVLYTSGSTGRPKGVEVPHRAVVNLLTSMQREPGFDAADALLAVTTVSFDIAALELFLPLVTGGRVILADRATAADPTRLAALIDASACTVMQATPATWRGLVEAGWSGRDDLKILCGGEALPRDLADQLLQRGASVWNLYGPTETTIWSTVHRVEPGAGPVPIGRPIANTLVYVLDAQGRAAPIGVPGELHIGGAGVARGYRGAADLTRARFGVRAAAPDERLYCTGDLARWRADGVLECLGRTDAQLKIRGFRVAPEEIEAALMGHPEIAACAVRAWPDASGEHSLAAYVVARGAPFAPAELRRFLRQSLPDYMVPTRYVALAALPMTPNAKIDRKALPPPETGAAERVSAGAFVEPRGPYESRLAAIWAEVLGVGRVGAADNFFELGGHSLLITTLLRRIESAFQRRLPMAAVFQAPTVAQMAALLRDDAPMQPPASGAPVARLPRTIAIQPKGTRPPLLWLSPEPAFRKLAEAVGPDQPFVGVRLYPDDVSDLTLGAPLSAIARQYVRAIRAFQPSGPYYVAGWCIWGVVAFEVAAQLRAAGQDVGLVVLLHTVNPAQFRRTSHVVAMTSKLRYHLAQALLQHGRQRWRYALGRGEAVLRDALPHGAGADAPASFAQILYNAALHYEPQPYGGAVALFQPDSRPTVMDYRPGWLEVVQDLRAFEIPATHWTLLEAGNVEFLGATMNHCLARAQAAAVRRATAAE
jgi:amino acid adenylation domain-containing protein